MEAANAEQGRGANINSQPHIQTHMAAAGPGSDYYGTGTAKIINKVIFFYLRKRKNNNNRIFSNFHKIFFLAFRGAEEYPSLDATKTLAVLVLISFTREGHFHITICARAA